MNTLKEKIEILEAMERGEVIQFSETDGEVEEDWEDLKTSELDFELYTYRVKPNSRLEVGNKIVLISDEGATPDVFELTRLDDGKAMVDGYIECSLKELYECYISVENVLWYFETYDYVTKKWKLITSSRFTIKEADGLFAISHNIAKWRPLYPLGFALKEN